MKTDLLILGTGIAGLSIAVKAAEKYPKRNIAIVTKLIPEESNTQYAQGGIAVVLDKLEDSFQNHIKDTLISGDGHCRKKVVNHVVRNAPKRLKELIRWGAQFDKKTDTLLALEREGGHSHNRIVHHKDITGSEVIRALLHTARELPNITFLDHHFALDLLLDSSRKKCFGIMALHQLSGTIIPLKAKNTVIATGGVGHIFGHTSNPSIATGDGSAMALRAGARTRDMAFVQYHPTVLYQPGVSMPFLISEAVRGAGAHIRNAAGERFVLQYDPRGELATRDIVSRCIYEEMKRTGKSHVFLDATLLSYSHFQNTFPTILKKCESIGIDIRKDWIPIVPAQHYLCGGISVDKNGQTSIQQLYACGESSYTGLHGANRLASNSLLEALVYAHEIVLHIGKHLRKNIFSKKISTPIYDLTKPETPKEILTILTQTLHNVMQHYRGIVLTSEELRTATELLEKLYQEAKALTYQYRTTASLYEVINMITVAQEIVVQSLDQNKNRGCYYNKDL